MYRSLPKHVDMLLQRTKISSAIMYNREYEEKKLHEHNVTQLMDRERNKKWSEEKCARI